METTQLFATTLNEVEDFVMIMKVDQIGVFRYYFANNVALLKGNITEADYGKRLEDILPIERANYLKNKYNHAMYIKEKIKLANEVILQNGNILEEVTVTPVFDEGEHCNFLVIVGKNITDNRIKEEKLHMANEMLDGFISSSGDGTLILDIENRVTRVNNAFLEIFGYEEEEILGHRPHEWQNELDASEFGSILEAVKKGKELRDFQTRRTRKDGTIIDISVTYSPYRNLRGEIIGVISSIRDISDRKKIVQKLQKSNEQYKLITENMSDIIAIIDIEAKLKYVSPSCRNVLKFEPEELLNKSCFEFVHGEDIHEVMKRFEEVIKTRNQDSIELRYQTKRQSYIWLEVKSTPVTNSEGEIIHIILVARDITTRKLAEKELHESKEKYKLISQNTSDLIKVYDLNGRIQFASPSHEEMLGYSSEYLEGKSYYEFIHPEDLEVTKENIHKVICKKEAVLLQTRLRTAIEDYVHVESIITPITNEKGVVDSFLSVSRNITIRLKNEELIRNLDRLSVIGQLAAGVAHEIRNPLTALKGFSKILKSTLLNENQDRYLKIMLDELERIELIVNEFMSLAKPQAIHFQEANLQELIQGTLTVFETQASLYNVIISRSLPTEDIMILCQPNQIKQVIMNFIKNAIEAMQSGGTIEVSVEKNDDQTVKIRCKDEGIGIEKERLKYLGTPFYTTKEKGIGLGLTISNKIIKEHGGEMTITSTPYEGTNVEVLLPILNKKEMAEPAI